MYNKVEICGVNTSKLKVLKEDEKRKLLFLSKNGNKEAREELINGNLRLVLSVIQSFKNRNENPDDLFQVGCIGLIKAIDNFDPSLDVKFSTYAVPMIIGEFSGILGGSMIIENIFGIPGIGNTFMNSINVRDYNFFMALTVFYTFIGLASGILIDISYGFIDPRIRMGSRK